MQFTKYTRDRWPETQIEKFTIVCRALDDLDNLCVATVLCSTPLQVIEIMSRDMGDIDVVALFEGGHRNLVEPVGGPIEISSRVIEI